MGEQCEELWAEATALQGSSVDHGLSGDPPPPHPNHLSPVNDKVPNPLPATFHKNKA